ncbi:MAG: hypothetical protein ACK5HU_02335 [Flavobacteriales bacterium]
MVKTTSEAVFGFMDELYSNNTEDFFKVIPLGDLVSLKILSLYNNEIYDRTLLYG